MEFLTVPSSNNSFVTGNSEGSVSLFDGRLLKSTHELVPYFPIDGRLSRSRQGFVPFLLRNPLVTFINGEIVVASSDGTMTIFNENLKIKKQITDGAKGKFRFSSPWCLSGNEKFIASSFRDGVVRYFRRYGLNESTVE